MVKRGEHFSAEFKFKVVLELLREESSLVEIASKYNITSNIPPQKSRQFKKKSNSLQNSSAYAIISTEFS